MADAQIPGLSDPRLGMAGIFLQLSRVPPDEYPLRADVRYCRGEEHGFARLVGFGMIAPRLRRLYERHVWDPPRSFLLPVIHRLLP